MKIKIEFTLDNDDSDTVRILEDLAARIEYAGLIPFMSIRDINGNTIGKMEVTNDSKS